MNLIARLQIVSDAFCALTGTSRGRASALILKDQRRLDLVFRGGATMTVANFEKAMAWFSANWPEGARWPEGVERPAQANGGSALDPSRRGFAAPQDEGAPNVAGAQ